MLYVCLPLIVLKEEGVVGSFERPDQDTAAYD